MQCYAAVMVGLLLHEVVVYKVGHDGDGDCRRALREHLTDGLVLESDHILTVDLRQVVVQQHSIPEGGLYM